MNDSQSNFLKFQKKFNEFYESSDRVVSFKINGYLEILDLEIKHFTPLVQKEIQSMINFAIKDSSEKIKKKFNELSSKKR